MKFPNAAPLQLLSRLLFDDNTYLAHISIISGLNQRDD
jgi:hypothetical protein